MVRNIEIMNKKCQLLEELGFTVEHTDSRVYFEGLEFDFSSTACDSASIIYTAMTTMFQKGQAVGKALIREEFKKLMSPDAE